MITTLNTCRFLNGDIYSNQDATFSLFGKVPKVDRGYEVTFLDVNKYGQVTPESFEKAIRPTTTLASFIWANNEIGSLNDMDALVTVAHKHHVLLHADATQIAGKLPINNIYPRFFNIFQNRFCGMCCRKRFFLF